MKENPIISLIHLQLGWLLQLCHWLKLYDNAIFSNYLHLKHFFSNKMVQADSSRVKLKKKLTGKIELCEWYLGEVGIAVGAVVPTLLLWCQAGHHANTKHATHALQATSWVCQPWQSYQPHLPFVTFPNCFTFEYLHKFFPVSKLVFYEMLIVCVYRYSRSNRLWMCIEKYEWFEPLSQK